MIVQEAESIQLFGNRQSEIFVGKDCKTGLYINLYGIWVINKQARGSF